MYRIKILVQAAIRMLVLTIASTVTFGSGIGFGDQIGDLFVSDSGTMALTRVDPNTGVQSTVSSGGRLVNPQRITVDANADILIVDAGTHAPEATGEVFY